MDLIIESLEKADEGDLSKLISFFASLEKKALLQALSIDTDTEELHDKSVTEAVIYSLDKKFKNRLLIKNKEFRSVNNLAMQVRNTSKKIIQDSFDNLKSIIKRFSDSQIHLKEGGPDNENCHWYKRELIEFEKNSEKFINFNENHYFIKASIHTNNDRLVFINSIHHIGRNLTGIMEISCFASICDYYADNELESENEKSKIFFLCSIEPFVITWKTIFNDIQKSYTHWLDASMAVAIKKFGEQL